MFQFNEEESKWHIKIDSDDFQYLPGVQRAIEKLTKLGHKIEYKLFNKNYKSN